MASRHGTSAWPAENHAIAFKAPLAERHRAIFTIQHSCEDLLIQVSVPLLLWDLRLCTTIDVKVGFTVLLFLSLRRGLHTENGHQGTKKA